MISTCSNKYKIIQVGICIFTQTPSGYLARPYNIYVFPRENFGFSPQITIDVSAADFNTKHGMDWNTWFREGKLIFELFMILNYRYNIYVFKRSI